MKNKHKPKHIAPLGKYRDSHKTKGKGNNLNTWPVQNHVISSKLWNLGKRYLNYKSQQVDNPNFRSKNKSHITEW